MKKFEKLLEKPWAAYTFAACCAVALYIILSHLGIAFLWLSSAWSFISPVVTGIVVAYLLNPVSDFFEQKVFGKAKNKSAAHFWSVVLTVACLVLFLVILLVALIPSLISSVSKLIDNWDGYTEKLKELLEKLTAFAQSKNIDIDISNISSTLDNTMASAFEWIKSNTQTILNKVGSIGTSVSNFFIGILFGVCFLVAESSLLSILSKIRKAVFKPQRLKRNNELLSRCNKVFIRYIGCTVLDALIVGISTLVFTLIMRMPNAGLIAAVVGITNIIPTFGPMIGAVISMFFLVLDKPINALWFLIFICVLQSIDGMIIKPRLFKGSLGMPAVWTLVLIILGGKIAGVAGILLAVPVAAMLVILYHESFEPRLNKRIKKQEAADGKEELYDENSEKQHE